jgi:hypothetical protein
VRDVFAEVSVFFAAMTRAMATSINPQTKQPYSIYDYKAIEGIVDGSGLFIQVSEEDIDYTMNGWGVSVSKDLIEGLLGLATGAGELAFAQGLIASIGNQGLKVSGSNYHSDTHVGTIIFVCEYLLGMPIVSAIVAYVNADKAGQSFQLGPCIKESSQSLQMTLHKDTYMFVTPKFIRQYSGDLLSVETDLQFLELVDYLQDLVERKATITSIVTEGGDPAPDALVVGQTYYLLGVYLVDLENGATIDQYSTAFINGDTGAKVQIANAQSSVIAFTPQTINTTAAPIGVYLADKLITASPKAFTVAPNNDRPVIGIVWDDSKNQAVIAAATLSPGIYSIRGDNLLDGVDPKAIAVQFTDSTASKTALVISGNPTNEVVEFQVVGDNATSSTIGIYDSKTNTQIIATKDSYSAAGPTPTISGLWDSTGKKAIPDNAKLALNTTYIIRGDNLMGGKTSVTVNWTAGLSGATLTIATTPAPTANEIQFATGATANTTASTINIKATAVIVATTAQYTSG